MIVGYARTSTADQNAGLEAQQRDLKAAGCEEIFSEKVSSVAQRDQFGLAIKFARKGDVLMVTKPDRLARSTEDLLRTIRQLEAKGVAMIILSMGGERLDTRNPTSKLMLTVLAGVATWEREIMLERQREGIIKAKSEGKYKGRKPTARAKGNRVMELIAAGRTREAVAKELGVGIASVYRAQRQFKEAA